MGTEIRSERKSDPKVNIRVGTAYSAIKDETAVPLTMEIPKSPPRQPRTQSKYCKARGRSRYREWAVAGERLWISAISPGVRWTMAKMSRETSAREPAKNPTILAMA